MIERSPQKSSLETQRIPTLYIEFLERMGNTTPREIEDYLAKIKDPEARGVFERQNRENKIILVTLSKLSQEEFKELVTLAKKQRVGLHDFRNTMNLFIAYFS